MTPPIWKLLQSIARDGNEALAGRRCLVLAPHPDDEVLACGGTIATRARQSDDVFIVYLTNGRRGAVNSSEDPCARRHAEALHATAILGVPTDHLTFMQFEDGHLAEYIDQATEQVRQMVNRWRIDAIFLPYRQEYHRDHLAAWRIGHACHRDRLRMYEYPIWYGPWLWSQLGWRARLAAAAQIADAMRSVKVNIAPVAELKRQALEAYRSQLSVFEREAWGRAYLKNFLGDYEFFFAQR